MLIVRVVRGIHAHLPARAAEWALGAILFNWGWILLLPGQTFGREAYDLMVAIAPEPIWGIACLVIGATRLIALVINGTFADTAYSRFSPHVRTAMSGLSCFFWLQIVLSFALAPPGTGLAVYPVLLVLDLYSAYRAAGDAKHSDMAARNARYR